MFITYNKDTKRYWLDVDNIYMNCYRPFNNLDELKAFAMFSYARNQLRLQELKAIDQEIEEIKNLNNSL